MGIGISLGNTMESSYASDRDYWVPVVGNNTPEEYEMCWGAVKTNREIINGIKSEGFDTIRIPVFWGNMMEDDGTYTINPAFAARVKEIVGYCQDAGLYTVINIHHFDEFIIRHHSTEKCKEIFTAIWTQIAEYFKNYPYTLMFENYNEYLGDGRLNEKRKVVDLPLEQGYEMTNTLNQAFVDAVRATGRKNEERVLIVSGYWTNIDLTTAPEFIMPKDTASDRLMVSVHYVDNSCYWMKKIGGKKWLRYIDEQITLLNKAFTEKNIPVFLGEIVARYPEENFDTEVTDINSAKCVEIMLNKLLDNGCVPVIWDVNDNFYSRTEYRIKNDDERSMFREISEKLHSKQ